MVGPPEDSTGRPQHVTHSVQCVYPILYDLAPYK